MGRIPTHVQAERNELIRASASEKLQLAFDAMHPDLQGKAKQLRKSIADRTIDNVRFYHHLGSIIVEVQDNPDHFRTPEQKAEGIDPVAMLEQVFDNANTQLLRQCTNFAETYSAEDLQELLALRANDPKDGTWRIRWAHVQHLLSCSQKRLRDKMAVDAAKEALTPQELHSLIKEQHGGARNRGGRKLAIPRTVKSQVSQFLSVNAIYSRRNKEVWNGLKHNMWDNLLKIEAGNCTPELVKSVKQAAAMAAEHEEMAHKSRQRAADVVKHLEKIMASGTDEKPSPPNRRRDAHSAVSRASKRAATARS